MSKTNVLETISKLNEKIDSVKNKFPNLNEVEVRDLIITEFILADSLEVAEDYAEHIRKSKAIESAREDAYMKRAYMLTEFGLDGSTCKQIKSWLDKVLSQ